MEKAVKFPPIDVWRMSASRPWQLQKTSQALFDHLKYDGELRYHLIESVLVEELSNECIEYAKSLGYSIHVIKPARGQGHAMDYALKNVIKSEHALKWEDDFMPEVDIPLNTCVKLMNKYSHINQICFNKRETMTVKECLGEYNKKVYWPKEQRFFELNGQQIPLVVKEKWWFGTALWRVNYIKPKFTYWEKNTHNLMNDKVLLPLAGSKRGVGRNRIGRHIPTPEEIEKHIGCYIYGKHEDKRMVFHSGLNDSIWSGELQEKWKKEGRKVIGF
jgi:hypothetical protein